MCRVSIYKRMFQFALFFRFFYTNYFQNKFSLANYWNGKNAKFNDKLSWP